MIIKGEKVILRPIRLSDAPRFVKWFNDPKFNKFMLVRKATLREEIKWIKDLAKKKKTDLVFAIETESGNHIGSVGLHQINKEYGHATLGIMIGGRRYWNKGYGTDASRAIINYGFKKMKLHRIGLDVYEYNPRAIKVYKRLGFKIEGRKRELTKLNGKYYDAFYMGLLGSEWKK